MKKQSLPLIWEPIQYRSHRLDIFKYRTSAQDGLPPMARMEAIRKVSKRLDRLRPGAGLWVSLSTPGRWYLHELKRLKPTYPSIAIK